MDAFSIGTCKYIEKVVEDGDRFSLNKLATDCRYDLNTRLNEQQETLFHLACRKGHFDIVRAMVEVYHCDLRVVDKDGNSPFHTACECQQFDVIAYLCYNIFHIPCTHTNDLGDTVLHVACRTGSVAMVRLLVCKLVLLKSPEVGYPWKLSMYQDALFCLLDKFMFRRAFDISTLYNNCGFSPVHAACYSGHLDVLMFFFAELGISTYFGSINKDLISSLIKIACECKHYAILKYLETFIEDALNVSIAGVDLHHITALESPSVSHFRQSLLVCCSRLTGFGRNESPLFLAVRHADKDLCEHIYDKNFSLLVNRNGDTLLHAACTSHDLDMVKMVYSYDKGQLNMKNTQEYTCLHIACEWGSLDIVKFLLEEAKDFTPEVRKAKINEKNVKGETLLHICISFRRWDIFEYLCKEFDVKATTNDGETPLHLATNNTRSAKFAEKLITLHSDVNATDKYGESPIFNACRTGDQNMVSLLLEERCNVFVKNKNHETIFHISTRLRKKCILDKIFEALDCFPSKNQNSLGQTLLHIGCRAGLEMVKHLSSQKKYIMADDINLTDKINGLTPLQYACMVKDIELFEHLQEVEDHDLEIKSNDGDTVLHVCCKYNVKTMVGLLFKPNCSIVTYNDANDTPLHVACKNGFFDLTLKILDQLKSGEVRCNGNGETLLHVVASQKEAVNVMRFMVENNICDHRAKTCRDGNTALHIACKEKVFANIVYLATLEYNDEDWYNKSKMSPWYKIVEVHNYELLEFLIGNFSDIANCLQKNVANVSTRKLFIGYDHDQEISVPLPHYLLYELRKHCPNSTRPGVSYIYCQESGECNKLIKIIHKLLKPGIPMNDSHEYSLLHYAALCHCRFACNLYDELVIYCLATTSSTIPSILHFACSAANEYVMFKMLESGNPSKILSMKDMHGRVPSDLYNQASDSCVSYLIAKGANVRVRSQKFHLEQTFQNQCVNVFVLGHSGVGKTTLIHTLKSMLRDDRTSKLDNSSVPTTGMVTDEVVMSKKNCVYKFHDFAGHSEFEMSHSLWLENLLSTVADLPASPPFVFLFLVKATDSVKDNKKQVEKWQYFVLRHMKKTCEDVNVHTALICSHDDMFKEDKQRQTRKNELLGYLKRTSMFPLHKREEPIFLNGLKSDSTPLNMLVRYLDAKFSFREHLFLSEPCLQLAHYLKTWFPAKPCRVGELIDKVKGCRKFEFNEADMKIEVSGSDCHILLPNDETKLIELLNQLQSKNYITLLKQPDDERSKWWIVHQDVQNLLSSQLNSIFSPKEFRNAPKLSSNHNTGVISTKVLTEIFKDVPLPIDLIESYLISMEYCKLIEDEELLKLITGKCNAIGSDRHFFFPGLINKAKEDLPQETECCYSYTWMLEYPKDLGLRFLHSLLVRLSFKFPSSDVDSGERRLVIWTKGLFWHTIQGIDVMVEVMEDRKVIALFRCKTEKQLVSLAECRADVIAEVRKVLKCSNVRRVETGSEYYLLPAHSDFKNSFSKMRNCLTNELDKRYIYTKKTNTVSLCDLLGFDSYIVLQPSTLRALRQEHFDETLLRKVFNEVQSKVEGEVFARILGVSANFEEFKQKYSTAPVLAFCAQLDKYSIFRLHDLPS